MRRIRYKYNPATCRYEPFYVKGKTLWNHVRTFLGISLVFALAAFILIIRYSEPIDELSLMEKNSELRVGWDNLQRRIGQSRQALAEIIAKDDSNYRVILDLPPLPPSVREAGVGGSERLHLYAFNEFPYILHAHRSLDKLQHQASVEVQSYNQLTQVLDERIASWAARPAIQPVSNDDLQTLHLTFGLRLHPIFKVWKEHKGLDFAAPTGTPVYATGDGTVKMAYFSGSYGNVIFLDHDYGYESRYAHLSRFAVHAGERVRRGQLIGYVGNTGHSVAPHLHYEILLNGNPVNPLNFFQRDLSQQEYQKLIELGSESSISLD